MIWRLLEKAEAEALDGGVSTETAKRLATLEGADIVPLCGLAARVRARTRPPGMDLCWLTNAKSGRCSEDCAFCAQSAHHAADCREYPMVEIDEVLEAAAAAADAGADRFCIVTSGRSPNETEFERALEATRAIRREHPTLALDASLGELDADRAAALREAGVTRYNHNIETAPTWYSNVCTTHPVEARMKTCRVVKEAGMELCCGGIIGMGEGWSERIEMAAAARGLGADCVPINVLIAHPGTPLQDREPLRAAEILKAVALFRLMLPEAVLKMAGGRERHLKDFQGMALAAGADGIIIGGYLTVGGRSLDDDLEMIRDAKGLL